MNTESQVLNVPIEDIIPNRFQPRLNFDETALQELAASIKEHGIIQPLVLRRLDDKYEIIAGERRYKAAKLAGLTAVPAIISTMDDKKSAEVAIVENVQRRDLSSIEEAKSYKALLDKGYLTQEELAKKMGLSQSAISNKLRLLSLSEKVQTALMEGKISERHARSLLQLDDIEEQDKWLDTVIKERLTVRELDKKLKSINATKEVEPSIEDIKNKATDIISSNPAPVFENISTTKEETMPNKFFNFLEYEEANMNTIEAPVSEPVIEEQEEEIEMLDFLVPNNNSVEETVEKEIEEINIKDMSYANDSIDKLTSDLQNNNYKVELLKDENDSEIKYTIIVKKED